MSANNESSSFDVKNLIIPNHIAIIMDGNGRWAKKRNLPRNAGHKEGAKAVAETMKSCSDFGIKYLTLYAFSSENWQRSEEEVSGLMELLNYYLDNKLEEFHKNNIVLRVIGSKHRLNIDILEKISKAEQKTSLNTGLNLVLAIDYGAREEIVLAAKQLVSAVISGEIALSAIDENLFSANLLTKDIPDPDLLIRTSGEIRLSNFLLWQLAYTEFYFTDILWPDFSKKDLYKAIIAFNQRERRYGRN